MKSCFELPSARPKSRFSRSSLSFGISSGLSVLYSRAAALRSVVDDMVGLVAVGLIDVLTGVEFVGAVDVEVSSGGMATVTLGTAGAVVGASAVVVDGAGAGLASTGV